MPKPDQTTLNHAAQIIATISAEQRADIALRFYFEHHPYLRPGAKRHISHTVFVYFRWLSWLEPKASPQKRLEQAVTLHERFHADPKSIKAEALAAKAVPEWLASEMELTPDYLRQIQRDPALWLRARPGRTKHLAQVLGHCQPAAAPAAVPRSEFQVPGSGEAAPAADSETRNSEPGTRNLGLGALASEALRYTGAQDLFRTDAFQNGEFEIQDIASQLVGHAAAPKPRETWWDACAGEGGKMLHLADLMENKGLIWATDRNARRLETLKRRAARAQLFNFRTALWDGSARLPTKTKFDGILVDAPCSGVGTWQRNPHARWTVTPDDVRELAAMQLALLSHVAGSLKSGGKLIYAVCTLTRSETTAVAEAFTAAHPELEPLPLFGGGARIASSATTLPRDDVAGVGDPGSALPHRSEPDIATSRLNSVAGVGDPGPGSASPATPAPPTTSTHLSTLSAPSSPPRLGIFLWPQDINANGMFIAAWRKP